jgi:hypothetical protein
MSIHIGAFVSLNIGESGKALLGAINSLLMPTRLKVNKEKATLTLLKSRFSVATYNNYNDKF